VQRAANFLVEKNLQSLSEGNRDLILFPENNQEFLKSKIFAWNYNSDGHSGIWTTNIMGVLNYKNEDVNVRISVGSRFDVDSNKQPNPGQPFLVYLLSDVFEGYFLDCSVDAERNDLWEVLLVFLFTYHLEHSYSRGLFKQYMHSEYNESCFKGSLDVGRHLKNNIPFVGRIAYNLEEFTHDNPILWLVRHAHNTLQSKYPRLLASVMNRRSTVTEAIRVIFEATPSYSPQRRYQLYTKCSAPIRHPFFTQYEGLRKTCLQILRRDEGLTPYSDDSEKVYGVLFDGAWLWEQFVAKRLAKIGLKHHIYGRPDDGILVFEGRENYRFYPDFTRGTTVVLDAKYKPQRLNSEWNSADVHQILSYMFLTGADTGGVIYPAPAGTDSEIKEFSTGGGKGRWLQIPFGIPDCNDTFRTAMDARIQEWENNVFKCLGTAQNYRKVNDGERTVAAIAGSKGKRITYRGTMSSPN